MAQETAVSKTANVESAGKSKPEVRNGIAEWAVTILLLLFGTTTLVQAFVIPTGSMEDTLLIGDHLLVDKLAYAPAGSISKYLLPYQEPKHGDIIVFRYPGNIADTFVKRVIGVPGDRIKMIDRIVYRNGIALNEPYVVHKFPYQADRDNFPGLPQPSPEYFARAEDKIDYDLKEEMLEHHLMNGEVVVPPGKYFAMGDNRDDSLDCRYWGFVPRDNIIGKPIVIYWSYAASTSDLTGNSVGQLFSHFIDLGEHFFTRTRWNRTLHLTRGFPDDQLPKTPPAIPQAPLQ